MKIKECLNRLIRRPNAASPGFHTGNLIRDRIADGICDYLCDGGNVIDVNRYFLRHGSYAQRLFLYLFRYDRTVGDIQKYRTDLDFMAIQIHMIDDENLRASLQKIYESRTVEYNRLLEKKRGI